MKKDVIYIDIEDDITAIIEKVKSSSSKIVALVPPKRSTVLNSVINMKLLMRSANDASKRVVLVTSEASLLSLAGGVGLHVAPNLFTKPGVPDATSMPLVNDDIIDGSEIDPSAPVGELISTHEATEAAKEGVLPVKADKKIKSPMKFKIPSFGQFRNRLILILAGLILLVGGWYWAFYIAPTASVKIKSQTSRVEVALEFTADAKIASSDYDKKILQAKKLVLERNVSEPYTPTGKKNIGEKASGIVTIQNCDTSESFTVSAGTILTSPDGLKFETLNAGDVPGGTFGGGTCNEPGEVNVNVRAIAPGVASNLPSGKIYDIDGVGSLVVGYGGQMSGGTDKNVTIVAQKDIDEAVARLKKKDQASTINDLRTQAGDNMVIVNETYSSVFGEIATQPKVGEEATSGNVSAKVTFSALSVNRDDLKQLVENFIKIKIEGGDQEIYQNGLDALVFALVTKNNDDSYNLSLTTDSFVGPKFDTNQLASDISGKRYSEIINNIKSRAGVVDVEVKLEPFWVSKAPKPSKIDINLEVNEAADGV